MKMETILITFNEKSTYKSADSQKVFTGTIRIKDNSKFSILKSESDKSGFNHENSIPPSK
jgi:hypothetical protein